MQQNLNDEQDQDVPSEPGDGSPHSNNDATETVLAVVWGGGKLGASYYRLDTSELFLLPDTVEASPDFEVLRSLFKQISPKIILACSRQDAKFLETLKKLSGDRFPEETDGIQPTPNSAPPSAAALMQDQNPRPHLFIEPGREFAPDPCKRRIQALRLPFEPEGNDETQHLYFITSLIPFSSIQMIRTAGALLKFLDKRGVELLHVDLINGQTPVLDVKICAMDDLVLVDHTAWDSLQIFNLDLHPSVAKHGASGSKEGLSVYALFNKCLTAQGSTHLRLQLLQPTRNTNLLKRRYDVIEHCVDSANAGFVESASAYLKNMKHIPKLLLKLSVLHATVKDWKDFYQTLHTCVVLGELVSSQPDGIDLFKDITSVFKTDVTLSAMTQEIQRIVDFDQSTIYGRFYPRAGLHQELDRKRMHFTSLPEVMSLVASEELQNLPECANQCCIVFIPEVGYLLAVKKWAEDLTSNDYLLDGFEYKFSSVDLVYYKSQRTIELDEVLGDSQVAIYELETYIMISLTENVMRNTASFVKVNSLIAELDSLMTMAAVARDRKFVRPEIVEGHGKLSIIGGRHPLIELNSDFVPNSTVFYEDQRIVFLTGPNASGKSIYLKQIGIIVLMGLCGSFVPANSAVIPTFDRLCTRIYAHESVIVGLSTFMIDLTQMSLALRNATKSSLIIVDEFGKGTSEIDGISLLQATLEDFAGKGPDCPTVFVSTHYYSLLNRLPRNTIYKLQTMEFMIERDKLVYLFNLKDGSCECSFAHMVALDAGTPQRIITRSTIAERVVRGEASERSLGYFSQTFQKDKVDLMVLIADQFLEMNLMEVDPHMYLKSVQDLMIECNKEDRNPPPQQLISPSSRDMENLPNDFNFNQTDYEGSVASSINVSTPPCTIASSSTSVEDMQMHQIL